LCHRSIELQKSCLRVIPAAQAINIMLTVGRQNIVVTGSGWSMGTFTGLEM